MTRAALTEHWQDGLNHQQISGNRKITAKKYDSELIWWRDERGFHPQMMMFLYSWITFIHVMNSCCDDWIFLPDTSNLTHLRRRVFQAVFVCVCVSVCVLFHFIFWISFDPEMKVWMLQKKVILGDVLNYKTSLPTKLQWWCVAILLCALLSFKQFFPAFLHCTLQMNSSSSIIYFILLQFSCTELPSDTDFVTVTWASCTIYVKVQT